MQTVECPSPKGRAVWGALLSWHKTQVRSVVDWWSKEVQWWRDGKSYGRLMGDGRSFACDFARELGDILCNQCSVILTKHLIQSA